VFSVAAAVKTTAATENKGRRENAPCMVRLFSAIDVFLNVGIDGQAGLGDCNPPAWPPRGAQARELCAARTLLSIFK